MFVHHASMWRSYVQPGHAWVPSRPVPLYMHVGQSSVTVFFMMTGFLFGAKMAAGRTRPIDWTRLYVSRVLRIYPLYGVALVAVLLIVAVVSRGQLLVEPATLARSVLAWAHFARPDLNGMHDTWTTISGVTWSLAYEWLFYSVLPLAALCFGVRPPVRWLIAGAVATGIWGYWLSKTGIDPIHLGSFVAGVLASVVTRSPRVRAALAGRSAASVAIAAAALVPLRFAHPYQWPVLALLALFFVIVASGNTIFGLLRTTASSVLGELSYSIYLLHGLLLFVTLQGAVGMPSAASLSTPAYWALVVALVPILVAGSMLTFRFIERPAIRATPHVQGWLAERLAERTEAGRPIGAVAG